MDQDASIQQRRNISATGIDINKSEASNSTAIPKSLFNQAVASTVSSYVFTTGKQKAQQALNIYSHIDYLRPYFDVEPKDVLNRLINSLKPIEKDSNLITELYGPLMILFTLCAIIIYQMKMASHSIQDGTLIGTAFFVCFSYWIGTSLLFSSSSFFFNSSITIFNYLSLIGYSLFSHCVVLFVGTFLHTSYDHFIFYFLWIVLCGAAGAKLAYVVFIHTTHPKYKPFLAFGIFAFHMFFLLYIHFAYHELAEEISHALNTSKDNLPAKLLSDLKPEAGTGVPIIDRDRH